MTTDENLLKWYMKGFNDELWGTSTVESDSPLEMKAYRLGADHALMGDEISSIDKLTNYQILKLIKHE